MKKLVALILVVGVIACSKKSPTAPEEQIAEHGTVELTEIFYGAQTGPYIDQRTLVVMVDINMIYYEPTYISGDSCVAGIYLDNGKNLYYRLGKSVSHGTDKDFVFFSHSDWSMWSNTQIVLSDSLAKPDSIIAFLNYRNTLGAKSKVWKVTPADTIYRYEFYANP